MPVQIQSQLQKAIVLIEVETEIEDFNQRSPE